MSLRPCGLRRPGGGRGLRRDSRGVAAMEFALCGLVLITALLGTVEVLLFFRTQNAMSYAASSAARYASKHSTMSGAPATQDMIRKNAMSAIQAAGVSAPSTVSVNASYLPAGANVPGSTVLVTMSYSWSPVTTLKIIPAMTITSAATLTIEN